MRISDWSSDVCSSDLLDKTRRQSDGQDRYRHPQGLAGGWTGLGAAAVGEGRPVGRAGVAAGEGDGSQRGDPGLPRAGDRKNVVEGNSESIRVDIGGRRIIKNKKQNIQYIKDPN